MSKRVRITGPGIFGGITPENPTGEIAVGAEFEIKGDVPAGWKGRAVIVGEEPAEGSVFVGNDDDDSEVAKARREVIEKAEAEFERREKAHADEMRGLVARAEKAEADLQHAKEQIEALTAKLKAFDQDGDGSTGGRAPQDPPSLSGKNKAELIDIAKAECVEIEEGATNADIVSAIELAREEKAKA